MAITRQDESDLLTVLHDGANQQPLWSGFLDRLRRRCGADYAALMFDRQPGAHAGFTEIAVDRAIPADQRQRYLDLFNSGEPVPFHALRHGRVYALGEFHDPATPSYPPLANALVPPGGPNFARILRVGDRGCEAWLVIACQQRDFSASDGALLAALAPHLEIAIRNAAILQRERLRAQAAGAAIDRLRFGWLAIDATGQIVDHDAAAERFLQTSGILRRTYSGRLAATSEQGERLIADMLQDATADSATTPRILNLGDDPRGAVMAVPVRDAVMPGGTAPVLTLYFQSERGGIDERPDQLMALYGLSRNEARLALLLSSGLGIAESARKLGLTLETTRLYSKRLYAKTGAAGMADLVRLVLTGVTALA